MNKLMFAILLLVFSGCSGCGRDFNAVDHREAADSRGHILTGGHTLTGDEFIACMNQSSSCVIECSVPERSCIKASVDWGVIDPLGNKSEHKFTFKNVCDTKIWIQAHFEKKRGSGGASYYKEATIILPGNFPRYFFVNTTGRYRWRIEGSGPVIDPLCVNKSPNLDDIPFE